MGGKTKPPLQLDWGFAVLVTAVPRLCRRQFQPVRGAEDPMRPGRAALGTVPVGCHGDRGDARPVSQERRVPKRCPRRPSQAGRAAAAASDLARSSRVRGRGHSVPVGTGCPCSRLSQRDLRGLAGRARERAGTENCDGCNSCS